MVKQTRVIFELGDIVAFTVRCNDCKGEVKTKLDDLSRLTDCPLCASTWDLGGEPSATREALRALRQLAREKNPTRVIRFEIDGEEKPR